MQPAPLDELTRIRELLEQQINRSRNIVGVIVLVAIVLVIAGWAVYDRMADDAAIERIYLGQFEH